MDMKVLLSNLIQDAVEQAVKAGTLTVETMPEITLEVPPEKEFGDYAANIAMVLTRQAKKPPRFIAETILANINRPDWLDKAEIAGPGFINFFLKATWLYDALAKVIEAGNAYGQSDVGQGKKVQVEFVSANPTGPLHVGHGRGAAVGSVLANILSTAGYNVSKEFYINDAGNQIDCLSDSVIARYLQLLSERNGSSGMVAFPENGYHGRDIMELAETIMDHHISPQEFQAKGGNYDLNSVPEALRNEFKQLALQNKLAIIQRDLANFGVTFDVWFSEKTLHDSGAVQAAAEELKAQGYMYEKDGALWLKSTEFGDDKDRVVIRENGIPTYLAADIAYHRNKFQRGFDHVINLWGADHHGYIPRMKAAVGSLGYHPDQLEVIILQMVSLYQNGELVKMSKRTGQGVTLAELMEEVGRDAARFFFIMRSTDSQLDFDLDLAKSQSNENPVYYIQYAHARISSIFRQAKEAGIFLPPVRETDLTALVLPVEIDLIKKITSLTEEVELAALRREPHRLARYAHELASLFHSFYNHCRVMTDDVGVQRARIILVQATQIVLKNVLNVLGVDAPEKM
jgi:arginyl-tRNA synthetase